MTDLPENSTIDQLYKFRPAPGGLWNVRETINGDDDCITWLIAFIRSVYG